MFGKFGTVEILLILGGGSADLRAHQAAEAGKAIGQTIGNFKRSSAAAEKAEEKHDSKES